MSIATTAGADPVVLRMATVAPDGTAWAREAKAFAREVQAETKGAVSVKWYLGGIAGDEAAQLVRMKKGQLDGLAGSTYCGQIAPALRTLEVIGVVHSNDEARAALKELQPVVDAQFAATPFAMLFSSHGFGHRVLFSRQPVQSLAELRTGQYWTWEQDTVLTAQLKAMGVQVRPMPLESGARAYENGEIDGFIVIPAAALAFQYSGLTRYFTDLGTSFLPGCLVLTRASLDKLPFDQQTILRSAAAKLKMRFEDIGAQMDAKLLGGLFARQGAREVPMSAAFRRQLDTEGLGAYRRLGEALAPTAQVTRLLDLLTRAAR
jgi:TRAP-type C4-dicarboxylate transport system substrate-binding protein